MTQRTRICATALLLLTTAVEGSAQLLRRTASKNDTSNNESIFIIMIAACLGFLLAILVTWGCYFLAGRRLDEVKHEVTTSDLDEKKRRMRGAETISFDGRRPVSSIRVNNPIQKNRDSEKPSDASVQSQTQQSVQSVWDSASMQSYIKDARKAAASLGGINFPRLYNKKPKEDLSTVDNTSADDNSVISSESGSGFSDSSSCSSDSCGSEDFEVSSEALSIYTSALTLQAI
jgi:hypothetical protein